MVSDDHVADARLDLGLGCCGGDPPGVWKTKRPFTKHGTGDDHSITCLTLGLPDEVAAANQDVAGTSQQTSSSSGGFSFSNSSGIKRSAEKVEPGDEEVVERVPSRVMNDVDDEVDEFSPRKKLRLSKEQSTVLEESFKMHSTLNTRQKQDLANQLNLRPRQVEVWFQNRRARTKLKQTEVECEMLKKCCETLREENVKLRKEVQELKLMKQTMLPYRQVHASALALCPSCERISGGHPEFPFSKGSRHWPNQAAHPSAAC